MTLMRRWQICFGCAVSSSLGTGRRPERGLNEKIETAGRGEGVGVEKTQPRASWSTKILKGIFWDTL